MQDIQRRYPRRLLFSLTALVVAVSAGQPPKEAAASITFSDNSSAKGVLSGNITIVPGKLSLTPFEYRVYFATIGSGVVPLAVPLPVGASVVTLKAPLANSPNANQPLILPLQGNCLSDPSYLYSALTACDHTLSIPAGVTHLLVRSHNQFGVLASTGRWTKIVDWTGAAPVSPAAQPIKVMFTDTDESTSRISGVVNIQVPFPEAMDVGSYRVYWHGRNGIVSPTIRGGRAQWIVEVPAIGYNTQAVLPKDSVPAHGVRRMYVAAVNRNGEASLGRTVAIFDQGYSEASTGMGDAPLAVIIIFASVAGIIILALILIKLRFMIVRKRFPELAPGYAERQLSEAKANAKAAEKAAAADAKPILFIEDGSARPAPQEQTGVAAIEDVPQAAVGASAMDSGIEPERPEMGEM